MNTSPSPKRDITEHTASNHKLSGYYWQRLQGWDRNNNYKHVPGIRRRRNFFGQNEFTIDSKGNKQGVYKIRKGDRIAQIVLQRVPRIQFKVVDSVKEIGNNRGGGFGSTGVRE